MLSSLRSSSIVIVIFSYTLSLFLIVATSGTFLSLQRPMSSYIVSFFCSFVSPPHATTFPSPIHAFLASPLMYTYTHYPSHFSSHAHHQSRHLFFSLSSSFTIFSQSLILLSPHRTIPRTSTLHLSPYLPS